MKTVIFPASNSNESEDSAYFILQFGQPTVNTFKERAQIFETIPEKTRPAYLTWLGESWGTWVSFGTLEELLDEFLEKGIDLDEIIDTANVEGHVFLDGDQEPWGKEDPDLRVECEEFVAYGEEISFTCIIKNGSSELTTPGIKIKELQEALDKKGE